MNNPFICTCLKVKSLFFWILMYTALTVSAQQADTASSTPDIVSQKARQGYLFSPVVAKQFPLFDLKQRYKSFNSLGLEVMYQTKSRLSFGINFDWFYGRSVKETDIFDSIVGASGAVIDQNGDFSVFEFDIRGHNLMGNIGYFYPVFPKQPNSGILLILGAGMMNHKIEIKAPQLNIPQINGEYEKGYDRLTYGFATKQYLGYQYLALDKHLHFKAGIEFTQGFTKGRRTWNYTTNSSGTGSRFDGTIAIKFGIIVPVLTKSKDDEEFFLD